MEIQSVDPYKFYSDRSVKLLKRALDSLQKQHEEKQKNNQYQSFATSNGIRGRAYFSDDDVSDQSDEEEDEDEEDDMNDAGDANGDNDNGEEEDIYNNTTANDNDNHKKSQKSKNKNRKKSNQKTTEEYIKLMGTPPSETLITDVQNDTMKAYALSLPTVLFPPSSYGDEYDNDGSDRDLAHFYQSHEEQMQNQDHLEPILSLYNLAYDLSPCSTSNSTSQSETKNVLVLLLQSGRFAAAIFNQGRCIKHTTSSRYTVRKGQGGSQSANDSSKGKAKSIGSQLRRAGETQLRNDVMMTLMNWKNDIEDCSLFFLSLSKMLQKGFWEDVDKAFGGDNSSSGSGRNGKKQVMGLQKGSDQVKSIPLDVGRPCYASCCAVYELLMTCSLLTVDLSVQQQEQFEGEQYYEGENEDQMQHQQQESSLYPIEEQSTLKTEVIEEKPLTPLHQAAKDGNIEELTSLLSSCNGVHDDIDTTAGPKLMTPLHYAAESSSSSLPNTENVDHATAAKCILTLLTTGHANPSIPDAHNRPPYYLAPNDTVRNAFRIARSELGEEAWNWTDGAKVGPPLSNDDLKSKREKAAEKKRKQRQRQKERKALEKKKAAEEERRVKEEEEAKKKEEDAKRARAGLKPKVSGVLCDFCQKDCKGKRKSQLFFRLDFLYCSSECMRKHQRELMAAAATARMKGN